MGTNQCFGIIEATSFARPNGAGVATVSLRTWQVRIARVGFASYENAPQPASCFVTAIRAASFFYWQGMGRDFYLGASVEFAVSVQSGGCFTRGQGGMGIRCQGVSKRVDGRRPQLRRAPDNALRWR